MRLNDYKLWVNGVQVYVDRTTLYGVLSALDFCADQTQDGGNIAGCDVDSYRAAACGVLRDNGLLPADLDDLADANSFTDFIK